MNIPCLTLHQPWASWVAWGWKDIETRSHQKFRHLSGLRVGIHAGKHWDGDALLKSHGYLAGEMVDKTLQLKLSMPRGSIIALASVISHRPLASEDSYRALCECGLFPAWGLVLTDVKPLAVPIMVKGRQGIWYHDVPEAGP